MRFKDIRIKLKLKAVRLRRFLRRNIWRKKKKRAVPSNFSWMKPVSHDYQVIQNNPFERGCSDYSDRHSTAAVQREQIGDTEVWFFGVFTFGIGDKIIKYVQTHFFDKYTRESQMRRRGIEIMRKAYVFAIGKSEDGGEKEEDEVEREGSASAMVINGERLVIASMGEYRAVVCRDGQAHQISSKRQPLYKRHWSQTIFPVRKRCRQGNGLVVGGERIGPETEFVILASNGIWEVMKDQEAVNLISHIEDARDAADCLANEALTRMSKAAISCVVIRFD